MEFELDLHGMKGKDNGVKEHSRNTHERGKNEHVGLVQFHSAELPEKKHELKVQWLAGQIFCGDSEGKGMV